MQATRRAFIGGATSAALLGLGGGMARAADAALLSPAAMRDDLALLRSVWEALHPGLRRYLTRAALDDRFEALNAWAARPRSAASFFLALGRLSAALKCGHSYPNPVNQGDATRAALLDGRDRVPFAFRWIDGRMIVTDASAPWGEGLRPGSEVLAIDGVGARTLLTALLPLARADGANDAKRRAVMEVRPGERFQAFDVYRPLLFAPRRVGEVELTMSERGAMHRIRVAAMTDAERQALFARDPGAAPWTFEFADGAGVLTMPDWALYNSKWDWRGFIDRTVDHLIDDDARGLVIDIRGNEGGLDCGNPLLARLTERTLPLPAFRQMARYRSAPAALRPVLDTWDNSFLDWGAAAVGPDPEGFYALEREKDAKTITPKGRRFAGKVVVLADAHNSSATFGFLQTVKETGIATIVGAPSGGSQRGINGGAYFFVRLPATDIEIDVPLIGYFPDRADAPDRGIAPDHPVAVAADDIATGRDRALAAALRLAGAAVS